MKRTMISVLCIITLMTAMVVTASAASSFTGKVWTGKPTIFGLGYYCTAAQNTTDGDLPTYYAKAYSYDVNGACIAKDTNATGNDKAVADSGSTRPYTGFACYGDTAISGNYHSQSFSAAEGDY